MDRTAMILIVGLSLAAPAAAMDRLDVPGGPEALRRVTEMPDHVSDPMVLVEAARAWYGVADPLKHPTGLPQRLIEHLASSMDPPAPGPAIPFTRDVWMDLLRVDPAGKLALALVSSRDAMLLYHGLMGMDDATLAWMASHRGLLADLLGRGAAPFATAGPFVRVEDGVVAVPGGTGTARAWQELVEAPPSAPDEFIRNLMQRDQGRTAWMFGVLSALDPARLRFAIGPAGEHLAALSRHFSVTSPEWDLIERPYWRPAFDASLLLTLVDPGPDGTLIGSEGFWREVLRTEDLDEWRDAGVEPLTAPALIEMLFAAQPHRARERWVVVAYGQRLLATVQPSREAGLVLRGVQRFPALAVTLERTDIRDPALLRAMFAAARRVSDPDPGGRAGDLAAWQSAVALVESSRLRGGLDAGETTAAYRAVAALAGREPAGEVAAWLLGEFVPRILSRPGAPQSAERALLQTISGALTARGPRDARPFQWEDLTYSYEPHEVLWHRMEEARAAQDAPSLDDALAAWRAGGEERRKAVATATRILPALAYALHQAASDTPALGADIPFRHRLASPNTGAETGRRPWTIAAGDIDSDGWHLKGSLLSLDLALAEWYVTRHGAPPPLAPSMDEPDVNTLATMCLLAVSQAAAQLNLEGALASLDAGGAALARFVTADALDRALSEAGIDPWRRRSLRLQWGRNDTASTANGNGGSGASGPAPQLWLSEVWQLGGGAGSFAVRWPLDGCACFGPPPAALWMLDGRRSAGVVGATAADPALRVALFLRDRRLPLALFGGVLSSAIVDVIHGAQGVRADDRAAPAFAASGISDARLEEHLLALVASGALARPRAGSP